MVRSLAQSPLFRCACVGPATVSTHSKLSYIERLSYLACPSKTTRCLAQQAVRHIYATTCLLLNLHFLGQLDDHARVPRCIAFQRSAQKCVACTYQTERCLCFNFQCKRMKIACDKTKPCESCKARNCPEKCTYTPEAAARM